MKALRLISNHISKALSVVAVVVLAAIGAPDAQAQLARTEFFPVTHEQPAGIPYDVAVVVKSTGDVDLDLAEVTFSFSPDSVAQVKGTPSSYYLGDESIPPVYQNLDGYFKLWVATIEVLGQPGDTTTITATQGGTSVSQQLTIAGGSLAPVGYNPYSANSEGGMPRSDAYNVRVFRPDGTSGAETISFTVQPIQDPLNNPALTASFVYVTPSTVSFAEGELFKDVIVTCSIPKLNIPPGSTVTFVYKVLTSGWSVSVGDNGFALNATVTAPPPAVAGPPVVLISEPSQLVYGPFAAAEFAAEAGISIPLGFDVLTAGSPITSVDATINGNTITLNTEGLGTATATSTGQLSIRHPGVYTVAASGTNSIDRTTTTTTFTVLMESASPPIVVINNPTPGSLFVRDFGTGPWTIPFSFTARSVDGHISRVSATLDGSPIGVSPVTIPGNTATFTASANLSVTSGGVHTLRVTATDNWEATAVSEGTFTINLLQATPTVTWATPSPISYGTPLSGTQLNATVSGSVPGTLTYTPASGVVLPAGPHTLSVTFTPTDTVNYSSVTKTVQLTVTPATSTTTISGAVFLDVRILGTRDADEVGLGGITVNLYKGAVVVGTVLTDGAGNFSFPNLTPDNYEVDVAEPVGLTPTDSASRPVTIGGSGIVRPIGLALNFTVLRSLKGDGMSQGYWKTNLSKTSPSNPKGTQETYLNLVAYTNEIKALALSPFSTVNGIGDAVAILSDKDQLPLQLLASEYNFVSGRLIGNSPGLTYAFVLWGEYVMANRGSFSTAYQTFVKNWMDAFNNSHGGVVNGPASP